MTQNINLADKLAEKIRHSPIGDLIDEADLYDITKQAIERAFFQPRRDPNSSTYHPREIPPLIVEVAQEAIRDAIRQHVDDYIAKNPEVLLGMVEKVIENGIMETAEKIAQARANERMKPMMQLVVDAINQDRSMRGLDNLYVPL